MKKHNKKQHLKTPCVTYNILIVEAVRPLFLDSLLNKTKKENKNDIGFNQNQTGFAPNP